MNPVAEQEANFSHFSCDLSGFGSLSGWFGARARTSQRAGDSGSLIVPIVPLPIFAESSARDEALLAHCSPYPVVPRGVSPIDFWFMGGLGIGGLIVAHRHQENRCLTIRIPSNNRINNNKSVSDRKPSRCFSLVTQVWPMGYVVGESTRKPLTVRSDLSLTENHERCVDLAERFVVLASKIPPIPCVIYLIDGSLKNTDAFLVILERTNPPPPVISFRPRSIPNAAASLVGEKKERNVERGLLFLPINLTKIRTVIQPFALAETSFGLYEILFSAGWLDISREACRIGSRDKTSDLSSRERKHAKRIKGQGGRVKGGKEKEEVG
ncbi:hypothetical protein ANTRET_LOCUS9244 [Anthophora retusa]